MISKMNSISTEPFPKLMQSTISGAVFLMTSSTEGTVVYGTTSGNMGVGTFDRNWASWQLVDFDGSITLYND